MILPAIIYFIIFYYIPMAGVVLAFKTFKISDGIFSSPWCGFKNFKFLILSGALLRITVNTALYNLAFLIMQQTIAMLIAIFITEIAGKIFKKICQQIIFLPYFVSYVILGAFIYNMFNFEYGALNGYLKNSGLSPVNLYNIKDIWPLIIVLFNSWKWAGYSSVIYLATASGINPQLYEAARIDGTSIFQRIRYITLPHFLPAFTVVFIFQMGRIMKGQFELFYNIIGDNSTLFNVTDVVDTYVFRSLVNTFDVGLGTAAGLYQAVLGLVLVILANFIVKRINTETAIL